VQPVWQPENQKPEESPHAGKTALWLVVFGASSKWAHDSIWVLYLAMGRKAR
jgi:hypothetical protein